LPSRHAASMKKALTSGSTLVCIRVFWPSALLPYDLVYGELKHIRCFIAVGGNRFVSLQNRYGRFPRGGEKPLFANGRRRADPTPPPTRREHSRQASIHPGDDDAERRAIIRGDSVFIEEPETTLQRLAPGAIGASSWVIVWG